MKPALTRIVGLAIAVALTACMSTPASPESAPDESVGSGAATPPATTTSATAAEGCPVGLGLNDLTTLDTLKTCFNADQGAPRLILLLSPT